MRPFEQRALEATLERLNGLEADLVGRLNRLDENLKLLRQDLIGDGQPGRIIRLEQDLDQIRAEYHRQRGIFAAISFVISATVALLSRFIYHR